MHKYPQSNYNRFQFREFSKLKVAWYQRSCIKNPNFWLSSTLIPLFPRKVADYARTRLLPCNSRVLKIRTSETSSRDQKRIVIVVGLLLLLAVVTIPNDIPLMNSNSGGGEWGAGGGGWTTTMTPSIPRVYTAPGKLRSIKCFSGLRNAAGPRGWSLAHCSPKNAAASMRVIQAVTQVNYARHALWSIGLRRTLEYNLLHLNVSMDPVSIRGGRVRKREERKGAVSVEAINDERISISTWF